MTILQYSSVTVENWKTFWELFSFPWKKENLEKGIWKCSISSGANMIACCQWDTWIESMEQDMFSPALLLFLR